MPHPKARSDADAQRGCDCSCSWDGRGAAAPHRVPGARGCSDSRAAAGAGACKWCLQQGSGLLQPGGGPAGGPGARALLRPCFAEGTQTSLPLSSMHVSKLLLFPSVCKPPSADPPPPLFHQARQQQQAVHAMPRRQVISGISGFRIRDMLRTGREAAAAGMGRWHRLESGGGSRRARLLAGTLIPLCIDESPAGETSFCCSAWAAVRDVTALIGMWSGPRSVIICAGCGGDVYGVCAHLRRRPDALHSQPQAAAGTVNLKRESAI
jgi:hypothetical protein